METLRERLAEKLGATKAPEAKNPNLVRVTARLDAPKAESHDGHAPRPAPRRASPAPRCRRRSTRTAPTRRRCAGPGAHAAADGHAAHWAYNGETGPAVWGGLKPEFQLCAVGKRQSPIDIRGGIAVDLDPVQFDYRATGFNVIDNGHTVQVNLGTGNSIQVGGRRYELVQFHFHRPSEERINGRQYDMSLHLVHKDPEGRLAVVGLLLERGARSRWCSRCGTTCRWKRARSSAASGVIDLNLLLPPERGYYTYMGSLTTPPCSEGVLWMVMRQPVQVSQGQIDIFSRLYPMNARPVQSASGRLIKQSPVAQGGGGGAARRVSTSSAGHSHRLASQRSTRPALTGRVSCCATRTNSTTAPTTTYSSSSP
jgi:carbonic anhydrase